MTRKITLQNIKELALRIDHDVSFGGKSKGNQHLMRVVRLAEFLGEKTGADPFITAAGALLHDTALPSGDDHDYNANKQIVKDLLQAFQLNPNEPEQIAECVASHEGTTDPKTLEAKVVHDADVLDKAGLLGIIRHAWKMTNLGKLDHETILDKDAKDIMDHLKWRSTRLQLPISKKMERYLSTPIDEQTAIIIVSLSAKLAFNGVITEKIAIALQKRLSQEQNHRLKEQLTLSYLKKFR